MGLIVSKMYAALNFSQPTRILLLGLDAAGKTTALYKLKMGELVTVRSLRSMTVCTRT